MRKINVLAGLLAAVLLAPHAFAATNESEAGIVITAGNSPTQSLNFKHATTSTFAEKSLFKFTGAFLKTSARSVNTARAWSLGARYERELFPRFSLYAGEGIESDIFAGFVQRYNTDVGGKYGLIKEEGLEWNGEFGYRYSIENRFAGQVKEHYLRIATDANRIWSPALKTGITLEFLPNLTNTTAYELRGDLNATSTLSEVFALKVGYGLRYRNLPTAPATEKADTLFTTALVAKY